jgi:thiamine biosynthesis lipoprotein
MTLHVEPVMGTMVTFDVRTPGDHAGAIAEACRWLHEVDATFSPFRPASEISRLGRGELARGEASPLVRSVLDACDDLERETAGVFSVRAGGQLDPCGYVKGWAAEAASMLLVARGATDHAINAGGDVRVHGNPCPETTSRAWHMAITHPLARDAVCAIVATGDAAIATSGTAERGAHVVNGRSGEPATALASVTVVGPDLTRADVYATVGLALGLDAPDWLRTLDGFEAYVVDAAGYEWSTADFPFASCSPQVSPAARAASHSTSLPR